MKHARRFLNGIIDYAGLFPPASLDMQSAVRAYAEYSSGCDRDLLGRFVVPLKRLEEFANASSGFSAWRLSLIAADDALIAAEAAKRFNESHDHIIDTIEMPAGDVAAIARAAEVGGDFNLFIEVQLLPDPFPLLQAVSQTRAFAKMRTGGVVESAIPPAESVLRFIEACISLSLPFKATAGLHHLVRGRYNLSYEQGAQSARMFGYLNIFIAAAFAYKRDHDAALAVLAADDASRFEFDDAGARWNGQFISWSTLDAVRAKVATSFGSCSFEEPVAEAKAAALI